MPYYREDLENRGCEIPGCGCTQREDEMYFHGRCHVDKPSWVRYRAHVLTVECSVCRKEIVSVVVASRADEERRLSGGAPGSDPQPGDEERCP